MRHSRLRLPFALLSAGILALSACESATEPKKTTQKKSRA